MEPLTPKLGSLAQNARQKHLKSAKSCLFVVAALQFIGGIIFTFIFLNQPIPQELKSVVYTSLAVIFGAGLAFLILGLLVPKFPIPCTVLALILFITLHAIDAIANPASLLQGIILKVIVIVVLVKAIQAAVAYERERKLENASPGM